MAGRRGPRALAAAGASVLAAAGAGAGVWAGAYDGAFGARLAAMRLRALGLGAVLRGWIEEEVDARRFFLWLPVAFGTGILFYFAADREPSLWAPLAGFCAACACAAALKRNGRAAGFRIALGAAAVMAGFATGCLKTSLVASPVLERMVTARVTAYVETIELRETGARLLICRISSAEGVRLL